MAVVKPHEKRYSREGEINHLVVIFIQGTPLSYEIRIKVYTVSGGQID